MACDMSWDHFVGGAGVIIRLPRDPGVLPCPALMLHAVTFAYDTYDCELQRPMHAHCGAIAALLRHASPCAPSR